MLLRNVTGGVDKKLPTQLVDQLSILFSSLCLQRDIDAPRSCGPC